MVKEILTTYWSQAVLIVLGIAYFVKRILDNQSKKIEIKYSLFQQNRISAVNAFFSNYSKAEFMWHKIPHWDILQHKIKAAEIDEIVWPPLYALKQSLFELKVYFPGVDHKHFEELYNNFLKLNRNLLNANVDFSNSKTIKEQADEFTLLRDRIFRENTSVIDNLTEVIRKSYIKK
jgi:hypothetical protein